MLVGGGAKIRGARGHSPQYRPYEANLPHQYFRIGGKIFGAKPHKFGAVGAVLENFGQIFEKIA